MQIRKLSKAQKLLSTKKRFNEMITDRRIVYKNWHPEQTSKDYEFKIQHGEPEAMPFESCTSTIYAFFIFIETGSYKESFTGFNAFHRERYIVNCYWNYSVKSLFFSILAEIVIRRNNSRQKTVIEILLVLPCPCLGRT